MLTTALQTTTATGGIFGDWSEIGSNTAGEIFATAILAILGWLGKNILSAYRQWRTFDRYCRDKYPDSIDAIDNEYYIYTRGQKTDPANEDEATEAIETFNLISHFCKEVFVSSEKGHYFVVLGDSGMGKTTFLLKLYQSYLKNGFIRYRKRIYFVSLADKACLQQIAEKEKKENAILLLDALDEQHCTDDEGKPLEAGKFLTELLNAAKDFCRVVITCRTQYFEKAAKEEFTIPNASIQTPDKMYISRFSNEDIRNYLQKRFPNDPAMYDKARAIVDKVPDLTARPIVLAWIEELCEDESKTYEYSCQVYEAIVDKWLWREAMEKVFPGTAQYATAEDIQSKNAEIRNEAEQLRRFCYIVTRYMWDEGTDRIPPGTLTTLAEEIDLDVDRAFTARVRTLLNRDSEGNCKFAHKSFYEYFMVFLWHHGYEKWKGGNWLFGLTDGMRKFMAEESAMKVKDYISGKEKSLSQCLIGLDIRMLNADEWNSIKTKLRKAHLSGAYLSGADLNGADLSNANLNDVYLYRAHLNGADLTCADLRGTYLYRADLSSAYLNGANLCNAYLYRADLNDADLHGVDLRGADLREANLHKIDEHTDFTNAKLDGPIEELVKTERMPYSL